MSLCNKAERKCKYIIHPSLIIYRHARVLLVSLKICVIFGHVFGNKADFFISLMISTGVCCSVTISRIKKHRVWKFIANEKLNNTPPQMPTWLEIPITCCVSNSGAYRAAASRRLQSTPLQRRPRFVSSSFNWEFSVFTHISSME